MAPLFRLSIEPQTARYPLHHHHPSRSRPPERLLPVSGAPSQYAALSIRLARPVGGRRHQADPASRRSLPANHIAGRGRGREGHRGEATSGRYWGVGDTSETRPARAQCPAIDPLTLTPSVAPPIVDSRWRPLVAAYQAVGSRGNHVVIRWEGGE